MKTKKKILIPLLLAVVCLVAGTAGGIFITLQGRTASGDSPAYYFAKSEQVPSITGIVGERSPLGPADETEDETKDRKADETASETETDGPEEQPLEASGENPSMVYRYASDSVKQDVEDYIEYLESEKNFIEITNTPVKDPADAPAPNARRLAGASQDEDAYLSITITEEADHYSVSAEKEKEPWNSFVKELWNTSHDLLSEEEVHPTIVSAEEQIRSATQQFLNLPNPTDAYKFIPKRGLIRVEGNDYYCVAAYLPNETGTFNYECAFLLDAESGDIKYQYNEATGETFPL